MYKNQNNCRGRFYICPNIKNGKTIVGAHDCAQGITLVALVVTIVVMLILSGVTINMLFSEDGIIKKAQEAANKMNEAVQNDQTQLNELYNELANVIDNNNKPDLPADGSFSEIKGINKPKLGTGMTPVKWDGSNFVTTTPDDSSWYNYANKQWANAITLDGSYWVWIPRYSYQIADNYHTNSATGGTINVEFMKGTTNESSTGRTSFQNASGQGNWNIHPAFNYGVEVPGIWVAKYEASQTDSGVNTADYQNYTGGTSGIIKIQPSVNSWRNITIDTMYTKCLNYNSTLNSHQMKNTEWGAVAYLSKSKYGKDSIEVGVNECNAYITGMGPGGSADVYNGAYAYNANYAYNTTQGQKASSTGTVYGIYDMSGGSYEDTAAYVNNGNSSLTSYGDSLYTGVAKNKDVYAMGSGDNQANNYNTNSSKYGDAVYETSNNSTSSYNISWFTDYSVFPYLDWLFFSRGGYYTNGIDAGIFRFNNNNGTNGVTGFRPVVIPM